MRFSSKPPLQRSCKDFLVLASHLFASQIPVPDFSLVYNGNDAQMEKDDAEAKVKEKRER